MNFKNELVGRLGILFITPAMDLQHLALQLGVSPTTVSRVLSGKADQYRIGKVTQSRVLEAAQASNVTVNLAARSLRLRVTKVIGLIVPDISNPFFAALARHIEHMARENGYSVLLGDSQESVEMEADVSHLMRSRAVDGLIIAPVSGQGIHLSQFFKEGKGLVLVDRAPTHAAVTSVVLDNFGAAREGVRYLAAAGHRAIGCLRGIAESHSDRERVRGYRQGMKELGLPIRRSWIAGGSYSVESGREGALVLAQLKERPTAILALGNLLALGALEVLHKANLSVPGDVSLISFDEQPWAASLFPPLTTIAQPVQEMGERAMKLMLEQLQGGIARGAPQQAVLPFAIIERKSVEILR